MTFHAYDQDLTVLTVVFSCDGSHLVLKIVLEYTGFKSDNHKLSHTLTLVEKKNNKSNTEILYLVEVLIKMFKKSRLLKTF